MCMSEWRVWLVRYGVACLIMIMSVPSTQAKESPSLYHIGQPATDSQIQAWDIDISPDGDGLPQGEGTVNQGSAIFSVKCAMCHGQTGVEGPMNRLVGGKGSLKKQQPIKTVGSYWPYATTLYDYIYRAMPYIAPQSLKPDEVYSLVAWLLYRNGIIPKDAVMNAETLPKVRMPNQKGFVPDPRQNRSSR